MKHSRSILIYLTLLICVGGLLNADLVLVENGESRAPIVVADGVSPRTLIAVDELADYMEKMSGARPTILTGSPYPLPEKAIWVGYQPVLDSLFPDMSFEFDSPEELVIAATSDNLVIAGRDIWTEDGLVVQYRKIKMQGAQMEYGTINAVYTFLQDYLGVRWFWPGELGEDVPRKPRLAFEPFEFRYAPQVLARGGAFYFSEFGNRSPYGVSADWLRYQRVWLDSLELDGGHPFRNWWDRFGEVHPEYFAFQPDGTRGGSSNSRTVKLCMSNPAVWEQWLKDVEEQRKKDPNQRVFSAADNDGWTSGHCICDGCRGWDHPDGELRKFSWRGLGQGYVALSDRHVTFTNKLAELLEEKYPDEELYVLMMPYGHSRPGPIEAVPADNVVVASVANFLFSSDSTDRESPNHTPHKQQLAEWAEVSKNLMWRPNAGNPMGWREGLPGVTWQHVAEDLGYAASLGIKGVYIDMIWDHWGNQGPTYYLIGQMLWNPDIDVESVMADYFQRAYGPGSAAVEQYWDLIYETGGIREPEQQAEAAKLLNQAYAAISEKDSKYARRIEFLQLSLEYTRLLAENLRLIERWKASGKKDQGAFDQAIVNWNRAFEIIQNEEYPYAVNYMPLRPSTGRIVKYHPDPEQLKN